MRGDADAPAWAASSSQSAPASSERHADAGMRRARSVERSIVGGAVCVDTEAPCVDTRRAACDATEAPTPIVTAARARFVSAFAAALMDSGATRRDVTTTTSRRVARRARARMGERASQWEHQAQFAGELFVGTSALVGGFLTFMYCHLRAQKRRRDRERLLSRQQEALL